MHTLLAALRHPIIQAPMAGVQNAELAIAACRAGIMGSLPAAMLTPEQLQTELGNIRSAVGQAVYNVNFFAHRPAAPSAEQHHAWLALLKPYFDAFGLSADNLPAGSGRRPFDETAFQIIEAFRPPVVSFHFGLPEPKLLAAVKATGAKILSSATTVAEARWLAAHGADAVIAQGWEAGGHRGMFLQRDIHNQSGTFSLLPNIRRAIDLPVIAAGGISDADTVRAAFALGAHAVQAGTAFLLANEAATSPPHRQALISRAGTDATVVTNLISGGFARGLPNRLTRELGPIHPAALPFPLAGTASAFLKNAAEQQGSTEFSAFWCGQNAALAETGSTADIVARLVAGLAT